jgi:hypothetical protein
MLLLREIPQAAAGFPLIGKRVPILISVSVTPVVSPGDAP